LLAVLVPLTLFAQVQREPEEAERQEPELLRAAESGDVDRVRALLERPDADVNAKTPTGETPLMKAAIKGHTEIVQALIAAGADHLFLSCSCLMMKMNGRNWMLELEASYFCSSLRVSIQMSAKPSLADHVHYPDVSEVF
jgi:ankyrin repeat protein